MWVELLQEQGVAHLEAAVEGASEVMSLLSPCDGLEEAWPTFQHMFAAPSGSIRMAAYERTWT